MTRWTKQWIIHGTDRTGICIYSDDVGYYFYHDSDPAVTDKILKDPLFQNLRPLTVRKINSYAQQKGKKTRRPKTAPRTKRIRRAATG